jgi:uncharacterized protein DUF6894
MPPYSFHISNGADFPDADGICLPDITAARFQAIEMTGAMLKERGGTFWNGTEWRMTVVDQHGQTVCFLRFTAI